MINRRRNLMRTFPFILFSKIINLAEPLLAMTETMLTANLLDGIANIEILPFAENSLAIISLDEREVSSLQ